MTKNRRIRAGSESGSISQRHGSADPDPDPPQNVMDPQHCLKSPRLPENYTVAVLQLVAGFYERTRLVVFFILKDVLDAALRLVSDPTGN